VCREECVYLHSNAAEREKILMLLRECLIRVSHTCVSYDLHSNAAEREKILMLLRERSVFIFILMHLHSNAAEREKCVSYDLPSNAAEREKCVSYVCLIRSSF